MIILLYGQDTYRSRKKLNEIIEHYKKIHKSGLNLKYFDGESLSFEEFKDEFQQTPMFAEKKLIVSTNISSNQEFKGKFLKNKKEFLNSKDIILFYEASELLKSDKFFGFLKKETKSQEFKLLEGEKLKTWIKEDFLKFKAEIEPKALDLLISYVGKDSWQLSNEIKKLVSFKLEKKIRTPSLRSENLVFSPCSKIEPEDVKLLVKPKIETDIFKTIDAIAIKDKKRAISLIHKHLEKGDSPLYLLSMINFQFRNILIIKDLIEKNRPYYSILKITKLHPFIVKKSYQQANKFTLQELKKIYQKIFQADLSIKTGKVDARTSLDLLLTEI